MRTASGLWHQLPVPFWVLGPMEEITDAVFRRLIWELGPPDVFLTEFVRVEQVSDRRLLQSVRRLQQPFPTPGVPLVAQIYGTKPQSFYRVARRLAQEGWVGIDINMGCPARQVRRSGAGSGLIRNPTLAREIVGAVREAADGVALSIKTRLGWDRVQTEDWLGFLLELQPDALIVHARTALQLYGGQADWNEVLKTVQLRNRMNVPTRIVGNGDLTSPEEGLQRWRQTGCDGLMAARAAVRYPWFWSRDQRNPEESFRLAAARRLLELFLNAYLSGRNVQVLKKFFLAMLSQTQWLQENRLRLVSCRSDQDFMLLFNI